jgi:hypothetical protein
MKSLYGNLVWLVVSMGLQIFVYASLWKDYDHKVFWLVFILMTAQNISNGLTYKKKDK